MRRKIVVICVIVFVAISGILAWRTHSFNQRSAEFRALAHASTPIEGHFSLTDDNGDAVTQQSYTGRYTLIFFGYTYCPDVCPTTLQTVAGVMDRLADQADRVVPLFITIDPQRDTAAVLKDYVSNFHPALIGLTGSISDTTAAARSFRAYFAKVTPDPDAPESYLMSHSARLYLMGPDSRPVTAFLPTDTADTIAGKIKKILSGTL